jgi:hypothetical protein
VSAVTGGAQPSAGGPLNAAERRQLRLVNVCVGMVLGAEGVLMLVLSSSPYLPVTASFLRTDPVAVQGPAAGEVLFRLAIGPAVAVFLLLAMADHLLVAAPRTRRWYEASLQRRANYARWIEYSSSIMIVLIYMFTGICDIAALLGLFAANTRDDPVRVAHGAPADGRGSRLERLLVGPLSVAQLPDRGTRLPYPVARGQVAAGLADLRQRPAHLSRREAGHS